MARILLTANTSWYLANFRSGLVRALQANGHHIVVLAPHDDHAGKLKALGCDVVPLRMDNKGTSPTRDVQLFLNLRQQLLAIQPDAVLSFTVKNNVYAGLASRLLGIPFLPTVNGLGTAFVKETWLTKVVTLLSRMAFQSLPLVIFQNSDDREMFIKRKIVRPDRAFRVAGSGVDLERFARQSLPGGEEVIFVLIARLLWDKGIGEFIEAVRHLRAEGAAIRCQLLGFLDVENRSAIDRATVEAWQDEGVADYIGALDDVRPAITAADCVVLPSYREGVPRSLLEGAAMGRPIITTDAPGCRDVVVDGETGFLCQPRDVASLVRAMSKLTSMTRDARKKMGEAGRRKMEIEFDESLVIGTYLAWIGDHLSGGSK